MRSLAARDRVERHPVHAADEDRLAVDAEKELAGAFRQLDVVVFERELADADLALVHGQDRAVVGDQFDLRVVERRLAHAARPPEIDVVQADLQLAHRPAERHLLRMHLAVARERGPHLGLVEHGERRGDAHAHVNVRPAILHADCPHDPCGVVDVALRANLQPHVAPNAAERHVRHDIPAVHVRRLAEELVIRAAAHHPAEFAGDLVARRETHRTDQHLHRVLRADTDSVRHVELVRNQHVLRLADLLAVEEYVRERVDAVKHEDGPFAWFTCGTAERLGIEPLVALQCRELERIRGKHRIWHLARFHKLHLATARHCRLIALDHQPIRDWKRTYRPVVRLGERLQLPRAIERNRLRICEHRKCRHRHRCNHNISFHHDLASLFLGDFIKPCSRLGIGIDLRRKAQ